MNKLIYLDNASSTPIDKYIIKKIFLFNIKNYGNHTSSHYYGINLRIFIEQSKKIISDFINSEINEIWFTSGATESNNLAIKGYIHKQQKILTSNKEHLSILNTCKSLKKSQRKIIKLTNNIWNCIKIIKEIKNNISMISLSHINNETGAIQNINSIGNICKIFNIKFHLDASQSLGKKKIDVKKFNISLLTLSSHKIYGPQGIGVLYINNLIKKNIFPIITGGGQQDGLRAGTLPVSLIYGFGLACKKLKKNIFKIRQHIIKLNKYFVSSLKLIKEIKILKIKNSIPDIINFSIHKKIEFSKFLYKLKYFLFSQESSCKSIKNSDINNIRISFGKQNTLKEIFIFINEIKKNLNIFKKTEVTKW